jgi:FkbM family methyltransferase
MKKFKISLIKIIILIGSKTVLGRGYSRKLLIILVEKILNSINYDISKPLFKTDFHGFKIYFYADNQTGLKLYFQRNENKELNFLKKNIKNNSWFIDIGSYIGLYTLNVANLNSKKKLIKTLSIEPNPLAFNRLKKNLNLLKIRNKYIKNRTFLVNTAIGNKKGYGYINTKINHASVKVLNKKSVQQKIQKRIKINKIKSLIKKYKIKNIYCIKIDTEGYEKIILKNFFNDISNEYYPKFLIVEHNNDPNFNYIDKLLLNKGYEMTFTTNSNAIYRIKNEKS